MATKTDAELMAFRPGDLAGKIEAAANRSGCTKSEVLRRALEMYLDLEPLRLPATYLGAASGFLAVAKAASEGGLFPWDCYVQLVDAVQSTEQPVRETVEHLFAAFCPVKIAHSKFHEEKETLTDEERAAVEQVERWNAAYDRAFDFPDLQGAARVLKRMNPLRSPTAGAPLLGESQELAEKHSVDDAWPFPRKKNSKKGAQKKGRTP